MRMYNPPHPGEVLKELYLDPLDLTITQTAKGLGVTRKSFSEIINGHSGISPTMAIRLSEAFDTTPEHWLNLQQEYNLWKVEDQVEKDSVVHFYSINEANKTQLD